MAIGTCINFDLARIVAELAWIKIDLQMQIQTVDGNLYPAATIWHCPSLAIAFDSPISARLTK